MGRTARLFRRLSRTTPKATEKLRTTTGGNGHVCGPCRGAESRVAACTAAFMGDKTAACPYTTYRHAGFGLATAKRRAMTTQTHGRPSLTSNSNTIELD